MLARRPTGLVRAEVAVGAEVDVAVGFEFWAPEEAGRRVLREAEGDRLADPRRQGGAIVLGTYLHVPTSQSIAAVSACAVTVAR